MFGFGLVTLCQGFVSSWGGLMTTRFFLGVFETGMFPGCELAGCLNMRCACAEVLTQIYDRLLPDGYVV